jgi:RNA polymerase sigma-70 factor (ECF subfamily)
MLAQIPKLRAHAMKLVGSGAEADDLVQDVLVRAWRFQSGFAEGTNLSAWMFRILRNEFLNQLPERRALVQDVDGQFAGRLIVAPRQEWRLRYLELLDALPLLTEEARDALLLVVGADLSYEQAAEICDCSVTALKQRVRRARIRLGELIDFEDAPAESASHPGHAPQDFAL